VRAQSKTWRMQAVVEIDEFWEQLLPVIAERMGTDDIAEVIGRSLSLATVITHALCEPGTKIRIESPSRGVSELLTEPLYGRPGFDARDAVSTGRVRVQDL
jgi:hypothetical protein